MIKHFFSENYKFKEPVSPHLAARIDGINIDMQSIKLPACHLGETLIVEGAGGLMVPLNESFFVVDLIKHLNLSVLLVARSGLGTINHTVLTIDKLKEREIPILGVVMNGTTNHNNRVAIEKYGRVKVLAEIEPIEIINADNLQKVFAEQFALFA